MVRTGGSVLPKSVEALFGGGASPDVVLVIALLLNIALIIFGRRRYYDLTREIAERRSARICSPPPIRSPSASTAAACSRRRRNCEAAQRSCGEAIAYCMIDLDNFKQINDMHGHAAGDAVLVMLYERVRALLPREARLARLGGRVRLRHALPRRA